MTRDPRAKLLTILVIALAAASCGGSGATRAEETVEMISGSFRVVADGRAEILIGEIGDVQNEEQGPTVDAVRVEVTCAEDQKIVRVTEAHLTEPVCRVQLQLVEITNWSPAKARLKVVWSEP